MLLRRSVMAIGSLGLVACNAILPPAIAAGTWAENPLSGKPLQWTQKADGVPFSSGQSACTVWPIESDLTVTATDGQICVKGKVYKVIGREFSTPSKSAIAINSNGSGESGISLASVKGPEPTAVRKVGECVDRNLTKNVWEQPFDGCVPNKDYEGKPVLTAQSTFLEVGDARWKFEAPAPATNAAK